MTITSILLDRDGTLIREFDYPLTDSRQVRVLGPVARALAGLPQRMMCLTNQSIVGRGHVTRETVDAINSTVAVRYRRYGVAISAFLVCPHAPWDGCSCRKPGVGLFRAAERDHGVVVEQALFVGNRLSDAIAASAAGCRQVILLSNARLSDELREADLPARSVAVDINDLRGILRETAMGGRAASSSARVARRGGGRGG